MELTCWKLLTSLKLQHIDVPIPFKKNIHLSVIADWQSQNINIQIFKREKNSVNLEQQRVLNWMFPKYCVFLSFGDVFKRHKSNPLDCQVQAYHFCASYQWCGEEREYIIQLHFEKKNIFYFFPSAILLHFMSADMHNGTKHCCFRSDHCTAL